MEKRVVALIFALCMLCSTLMLLASCSPKDSDVAVSRKSVEIDLTEYALVYPDPVKDGSYSQSFQISMGELADRINAATGLNIRAWTEGKARSDASSPEILVGLTSRAESREAYSSIKGDGYTVQVIGNKIVIVGTTPLLSLQAAQYFAEKYLTGDGSSKLIEVNESAKAEKLEMVTLADTTAFHYTMVYGVATDTDGKAEYGAGTTAGQMSFNDYVYDSAVAIRDRLVVMLGLKAKTITMKTDAEEQTAKELAIGITTRPVTLEHLATLAPDECGVYIKNGEITVSAWNYVGMVVAAERFLDYLYESQVKDEAGNLTIQMPATLSLTGFAKASWRMDFPKPEGVTLYNTCDVANDSLEYLYLGDGVSAEAFNAYGSALLAAGYQRVTENEIEDSLFATYYKAEEKHCLYVAYNAFKHAKEDNAYPYTEPTLRVVSMPTDSVYTPAALFTDQYSAADKKTDSSITAVELPSASTGTGYIVTLEDGRFVIIDSGNSLSGTELASLWDSLVNLHKRVTGADPSSANPIKVAAWLLTHSHGDHYGVFLQLLSTYGKSGYFELEHVIGNFPSLNQLYNTTGRDYAMADKMEEYQRLLSKPFTFVKAHTGQKLYFSNLEIETLYTHEDMNPHNIVTLNDSSSIMRLNLRITGGDTVSLLSTGDAFRYSGHWCTAMYGDYLQSDMVTVSHHGGPGMDPDFYTYVAPEVVWWPMPASRVHGFYLTSKEWYCKTDQHAYNLPSVKYVYCSSGFNTTLYLRATGPDFENLYNAYDPDKVPVYDQYNVIKK